jgi:hypothetical protein
MRIATRREGGRGGNAVPILARGQSTARNRRFARPTDALSRQLENLEHSVALHFFVYNFITRHGTLRMPPALRAGVADHWWTNEESVNLIDTYQTKPIDFAAMTIRMVQLPPPRETKR